MLILLPFSSTVRAGNKQEQDVLKIALYPFIPDANNDYFASLLAGLTNRFHASHPHYRIKITIADPAIVYNPLGLKQWLESGEYDIIEIDSLLLGSLIELDVISPWNDRYLENRWHSAAKKSTFINGKLFGIPHYLCSHFIFSQNEGLKKAYSLTELVHFLTNSENFSTNLMISDAIGAFSITSLYLDAANDIYHSHDLTDILASPINREIIKNLETLFTLCERAGQNPCLLGEVTSTQAIEALTTGYTQAILGFSETLHLIKKKTEQSISIISLPLGEESHPVVFVDSLIKRKGCIEQCEQASDKFVEFLLKTDTLEYILMSEDVEKEKATPRYLIPSSLDISHSPKLAEDSHYLELIHLLDDAIPFPHTGIPERRKNFQREILKLLTRPLQETTAKIISEDL